LNLLGTNAIAAYTVACKVEQLFTQFFSAQGMTCATYGAQNMGIGNVKRIKKGVKYSLLYCVIYAIAIYIILYNSYPFFTKLFTDKTLDASVLSEITTNVGIYIHLCGLFFTPLGMIFIFRNIMQGCGYSFYLCLVAR